MKETLTIKRQLEERLLELNFKERFRVYLYGSLARTLRRMKPYRLVSTLFREDSDIDVLIVPPIGGYTLSGSKCREVEKRLGGFVNQHKIHVFSHPSALDWKERILLKEFNLDMKEMK